MYEVQVYNGSEWYVVLSTMCWGKAQQMKWKLVKIYGSNYVQMVYASVV
jgi:hypothetical protein